MRLFTSCLPGSWISVPARHKGHPPQHDSKCLTKTSRSQQQHLLLRKHTSSCLDPPVCNPRLAPAVSRVQRNSALTLALTTQACHLPDSSSRSFLHRWTPSRRRWWRTPSAHRWWKRSDQSFPATSVRYASIRRYASRQQLWGQTQASESQTERHFLLLLLLFLC